jgi:hypothetical protein
MKEFIKNRLEIRRTVYLSDSNLILEDFRKEREKIDEYNGRQLLEMLQNADDEAITNKKRVCYIELTENRLIIANNGRKFSEGGIDSLIYVNLSPKVNEPNKVGQKGLGFRSILSWANKITIKSYDFAVEFSEETAKEFLNSLVEEKPEIKSQLIEKEKNEKYPIAILRCPKILETIPENLSDYDTYIVIDLKESQIQEVQEQINNEINKEVLLFLNNLKKIIVDSPERNFEIEKKPLGNKVYIRELNRDKNEEIDNKWNIKSRAGNHQNKNYELKIAWNDNLDDKINRLYSYFKTNVKFPFPALIHGTFDLTSDRNHFTPKSEHNIFLIGELIQLLIDTALEISKNEISYKALQLLSINDRENFDTFFDDNNFADELKNKIRQNNIYPTIDNKYISFESEPIYYQNNYAEILPTTEFSNLLLFTNDENIKKTIERIGYYTYKEEFFFESISKISTQLNLEQRAKLISYLIKDFSESQVSKKELPNIFIDQDNQVIDSESEIFLPPSGEEIKIPIQLNLKIINSDLFSLLRKILISESAEVIEDKLKLFGVKVYRFGDIFKRIVSDFNNNTDRAGNKRESIKGLLSTLYELYIKNKDKEGININIPSDISIPIFNKNNGETKVSNVYLGKEYENKLCEILYEYDKSKLVCSPKILGLEDKGNVKEFLKWLGVAEFPRRKMIDAEDKYGHFAIKQFPYEEKNIYVNDVSLNSFNKLNQKGYQINEIKVETIENLENILENNSNENLLYWLKRDSELTIETEKNLKSYIKFSITSKYYYAFVKNKELPSYLLWKIKQIDWIKTKTDKKAKPTDCCIAKTITEAFSPFIEIPQIEYDCQLFKDAKIAKEDIDYLLSKIGINKAISDFSTEKIYTMLSNLHNIDKEGKIAKLIYREIAENLDDKKIDKESNSYKTFIQSGLVYCKINDKYLYQSIKEVYYVEDKTFGEDIINQFHTIEIDRRKGARKINAIFGVTPLENLQFKLKSDPTIVLNNELKQEIEELKPYVYAFRTTKDTDGKELKWIKDSKITLCTEIAPRYNHNNEIKDFELKPYEFIYVEEKNEVFLLIEKTHNYSSISDFQSDYKFADSIAEIFSRIIKIDAHRSSFRELFKETKANRDYIIKTELDDKNLEKLKDAKKKLNLVDDPKIRFWFSILSTLNRSYEYRKYEDSEFIDLIYSQINVNVDDFSISYDCLEDLSNIHVIIKLFKTLKIDVADYNKNSTMRLNFIPYYKSNLQQLKNDFQTSFEVLLFLHLQKQPLDEKEKFLDIQSSFEKFDQFDIKNSVKIDIKKLFIETIKSEFKIDLSIEYETIDTLKIYNSNMTDLESKIPSLKKSQLKEIINNNSQFRSLIYFSEFENIITEYNNAIKTAEDEKEMIFNGSTLKVSKENYAELYNQIIKQDLNVKSEKINTKKPDVTIDNDKKDAAKGIPRNLISTTDKEILGFIGEIIVFESLKKEFGIENVIWDSGYAQKASINPNGNDSKHYDIKYKNKDGWNFVEVKTTTSDKLQFKISNLEVNFGIENKSNYEIRIVTNVNEKEKCRIKILSNPFKFGKDENFTDNMKFHVLNDNFTIRLIEK